jgi:hypothetical protein
MNTCLGEEEPPNIESILSMGSMLVNTRSFPSILIWYLWVDEEDGSETGMKW